MEVLVIGTEPPCPRCDLLSRLVAEVASPEAGLKLRHCSFASPEAQALSQGLGRKAGTAKDVARDAGITMDWDAVYDLINRKKASSGLSCRPADLWTPELDSILEPCRLAAEAAGYLMTPVLVVNGEVKHHGSVPSRQQITDWLSPGHCESQGPEQGKWA